MTPASISGTTPGVLDSTQPLRLLRRPSSTLSFATFDPRVASADHGWDLRSLSLNEELYRPKRVVIGAVASPATKARLTLSRNHLFRRIFMALRSESALRGRRPQRGVLAARHRPLRVKSIALVPVSVD